jgi:hypothetical protein
MNSKQLSLLLLGFFLCPLFSHSQTTVLGHADLFVPGAGGYRVLRQYVYTIISPKEGGGEIPIDTFRTNLGRQAIHVKAYPNPTTDMLVIESLSFKQTDRVTVSVVDVLGRVLIKQPLTKAQEQLPFQSFVPGTYTVNYFLNEKLLSHWKVVKQ